MTQWHYEINGDQHGPVSPSQLKQLATSGQLKPTDHVWREGMQQWKPASKLIGLFEHSTEQSQSPESPNVLVAPPIVTTRTSGNFAQGNPKKNTKKIKKVVFSIGIILMGVVLLLCGTVLFMASASMIRIANQKCYVAKNKIEQKEEHLKQLQQAGLEDHLSRIATNDEDSIQKARTDFQAADKEGNFGVKLNISAILAIIMGPILILSGLSILLITLAKSK